MNHSTQNSHLIHRLVFEVTMPDQGDNFAFQNVLTNLCKEKIVPVVDAACSDLAKGSENIVIDRLDIDLRRLAIDHLTDTLPNSAKTQILAALAEKIAMLTSLNSRRSALRRDTMSQWHTTDPDETPLNASVLASERSDDNQTERSDDVQTRENRILAVFTDYLSKGIFPWWVGASESQRFIKNIIAHFEEQPAPYISILRKIVRNNRSVELERFISSFTDQQLEKIQTSTHANRKSIRPDQKTISDIQKDLNNAGVFYPKRTIYWSIVFSQTYNESYTATAHEPIHLPQSGDHDTGLEAIVKDYQKKIFTRQIEKKDQFHILASDKLAPDFFPETYANETEIPVSNSGLVITAAYLGMLFKNLFLINKDGFLSDYHRCKAVHLLQYMVVGNDDYQEFQLPLNKILCGMEVSDPLFKVALSKAEEKEAADLLFSLIKQWSVLKSTSIESLRTSFFQRPGILRKRESAWRLRVERRSFDLLLERLPWTISLIKYPWMPKPLDVEW